jgi:hypothetical protein
MSTFSFADFMNTQHFRELLPACRRVVPFQEGADKLLRLDFTDANKGLTAEIIGDTDLFSRYISGTLKKAGPATASAAMTSTEPCIAEAACSMPPLEPMNPGDCILVSISGERPALLYLYRYRHRAQLCFQQPFWRLWRYYYPAS